MTDRELMQQWMKRLSKSFAKSDWTDVANVHNEIKVRLAQCDRCGEASPAEIHTCSPQPERQFLSDVYSVLQAVEDIVEQDCSLNDYNRHQAVLAEVERRLEQAKA